MEDLMELVSDLVVQKHGGDGSLSDGALEQMMEDLHEQMESVIENAMVSAVPGSRMGEFESLIDRDASESEMAAFFQKHVPDMDRRIDDAVQEFVNRYLGKQP